MKQETGETRDAIIEVVEKRVQLIISKNKNYKKPYWIVIFAKPSKNAVDGKPTLVQHIKEYYTKPMSQVGMLIGEVDNESGDPPKWEVNMPQAPLDIRAFEALGAKPSDDVVVETSTLANAYLTK